MYKFFQDLNDSGSRLFNFRGSYGSDYRKNWFRYEICSGPALRLKYQHGEADDAQESSLLSLGLGFFSVYLHFYLPKNWYFKRKCIATWDNNKEFWLVDGREYGFYFYDWAFVWSFHQKINESSSKDPWWMKQYIHLDNIFGKKEYIENNLASASDVKFKIGDKEFLMNEIKWTRRNFFRRFIPYSLYNKKYISVEMKIDKPPMRAGKGENSWDCGDDGTFGLSTAWTHELPNYRDLKPAIRLAIKEYTDGVFEDCKRYGKASGERNVNLLDKVEILI